MLLPLLICLIDGNNKVNWVKDCLFQVQLRRKVTCAKIWSCCCIFLQDASAGRLNPLRHKDRKNTTLYKVNNYLNLNSIKTNSASQLFETWYVLQFCTRFFRIFENLIFCITNTVQENFLMLRSRTNNSSLLGFILKAHVPLFNLNQGSHKNSIQENEAITIFKCHVEWTSCNNL